MIDRKDGRVNDLGSGSKPKDNRVIPDPIAFTSHSIHISGPMVFSNKKELF